MLSGVSCLLVAAVATILYGGVAGTVTGLTLLTSFEWLRAATTARVDKTLAFGLTLVFVGLLLFRRVERRRWLVMLYAGAMWATLSKGIPGLAIRVAGSTLCVVATQPRVFRAPGPLVGLTAVVLASGAVRRAARGGRACESSSTRTWCAPSASRTSTSVTDTRSAT